MLKDFLIERFIPGVELLTAKQYAEVAGKSNAALSQLGAGIEWVSSFIVKDMTFCHYRAQDEEHGGKKYQLLDGRHRFTE